MSPLEKAEFIRRHAADIIDRAFALANAGYLPENWGGFELKVYLAEAFDPKFAGEYHKKLKAKTKRQIKEYVPLP